MNTLGFELVVLGSAAAGFGGVLIGVGGGIGMTLARKGRRPPWLGPALIVAMGLGIVAAGVGIYTATNDQPFSLWLGSLISGCVVTAFAFGSIGSPSHSGSLKWWCAFTKS